MQVLSSAEIEAILNCEFSTSIRLKTKKEKIGTTCYSVMRQTGVNDDKYMMSLVKPKANKGLAGPLAGGLVRGSKLVPLI